MRPATIFREYIWLVSTIRRTGKMSKNACSLSARPPKFTGRKEGSNTLSVS